MAMVNVVSSNILSVEYDKEHEELTVVFKNGSAYVFYGVSLGVYSKLLAAKSVGVFFMKNIRGKYTFSKKQLEK